MADIITLEMGWARIKNEGIDLLTNMLQRDFDRSTRPFNNKEYMGIYNLCYKMCTQRSPHNWSKELYEYHGATFAEYLKSKVLPTLQSKDGVYLLQELCKCWENQNIMNRWMFKFFMYLDRYYVEHHNQAKLQEAGMTAFKREVFDKIKSKVTAALIAEINRERDGQQVDRGIIKKCVEVYERSGEGNLDLYQIDFDKPLLHATKTYYKEKAVQWIATDNVPTYLDKVEQVLVAEAGRVHACMHESTEAGLLREVEEVLLAEQQSKLLENEGSGLRVLLREEKRDDLSRLYRLYNRLGDRGLDPIATVVREHFQEIGLGIVKDRDVKATGGDRGEGGAGAGAAAGGGKPEKDSPDTPSFVIALLDLHDKARSFVNTEFNGHTKFQKALKDAFEVFVNKEVESKYSNAECIATYCDRVLKTGGDKLSEEQIEEALERVVQLFSYIADKDVFQDIYRNHLSKRALNQRSVSNDSERSMISKLKLRCGAQYTNKMEGMLNDLTTASDGQGDFKNWLNTRASNATGGVDFTVQVLTMGWWPNFSKVDLILPPGMAGCQKLFEEYYGQTKQHRRLQWVHASGNANVKAVFGKNTYELQVVTLQAVVLMLFNDKDGPVDFETIKNSMGCDVEIVRRTLHSLACGKMKVLTKSPESNTINVTDTFAYNAVFTSQLRRLRIPMASLEESHNPKKVEDDRGHAIEACIVRIMKSRKQLQHQQLIAEVISQLHFFKPNPKVIKKRIEHLIDREYLERAAEDANIYKYLA